ncbi:MAG: hypothetical protein K9N23_18805 [Akkermansiaceae bacterium]|nr:hypothetical protein [Akkermansiaceae bacterium]
MPALGYQVPALEHASPTISKPKLLIHGPHAETSLKPDPAHDGDHPAEITRVLSQSPPLQELAMHPSQPGLDAAVRELQVGLALLTSVYHQPGARLSNGDCPLLSVVIERRVAAEPFKVLEIVETEVALHPNCACEVVKAAIKGSEADEQTVVSIVEAACSAAPAMMRIISQCAIACVPGALPGVQAVLSRLDPSAGNPESNAKSSKSAKSSKGKVVLLPAPPVARNPLDLPPMGPPILPPPIFPPPVSRVLPP